MDTQLCFAISHLRCFNMQIIIKHKNVVYFMYFKQKKLDMLCMYITWNVSSNTTIRIRNHISIIF